MSQIVAQDISLAFGDRIIFENVSFRIGASERIGLVGPNGSGKSTLLRILAGEMTIEKGSLQFSRELAIGYLPQDILEMPEHTVIESVLNAVPGYHEIRGEYFRIVESIEESNDPEEQMKLAEKLALLQERKDYLDLHFSQHEAMKILFGLGFTESDLHRPNEQFSGGWKMRIALAGILFRKPDLILLDEPTNHLDMPSVLWFDDFLHQFQGSVILVSHDRYFLNRQIRRVMSFEPEGLRFYNGNYDHYQAFREEEEIQIEARARNVEKERKELERFVERFKAKATKARQAQSRVKMIQKLEKDAPKLIKTRKKVRFTFPEVSRSSFETIKINNLSKSFGDIHLFDKLSLSIYRGERLAIIGKNGVGKTTLLKMIAQEIPYDEGSIEFGANVDLRYYAQHHAESLNLSNSVLDEVHLELPMAPQTTIRKILGAFLFSGDEVEKTIQILSGGEKARVALAKLLVRPGNVLLMDEPTNHLDVDSSEALAKALNKFNGTLVFVSHNRSFVDQLATRIWDISEKGIEDFQGNLNRYLEHLEVRKKLAHTAENPVPAKPIEKVETKTLKNAENIAPATAEPADSEDSQNKKIQWELEKEERRKLEKERKEKLSRFSKYKKRVQFLEKEIADGESKKELLEKELANPLVYEDSKKFHSLMDEHAKIGALLQKFYKEWEEKLEFIEQFQGEQN